MCARVESQGSALYFYCKTDLNHEVLDCTIFYSRYFNLWVLLCLLL